jgi:hypothetical protein
MCLLTDLPAETLLGIYNSCSSVNDVLNLSQTCRRLHALLPRSQKLSVLLSVAEAQAGPIFDIVQLLTVNDVQAAHEIREPSMSYHLLRDILSVAQTAQEWQEIYPREKWDEKYADRRLLNAEERYALRRAIYRLWLFSRAFHNCNYPRESRLHPTRIIERCRLLRAWSTEELAEIEDFRGIMRSVLESALLGQEHLYWELEPTSGRFHRKPCTFPLASRSYLNSVTTLKAAFHTSNDDRVSVNQRLHGMQVPGFGVGMYGWVDDINRFYVLEDLMKLDPEQVLWLQENAYLHLQVPDQVGSMGEEWFINNGETFAQTFEMVMADRGEDAQEIRERIARGDLGIARGSGYLQHVQQL